MPQIQILPKNPGFGEQFGQSLGHGVSNGVSTGITQMLSDMLSRKKEIGNARKDINSLAKQYPKGTFEPPTLQALESRTVDLIREGKFNTSREATIAALQELTQKQEEDKATQAEKTPKSKTQNLFESFGLRNSEEVGKGLKDIGEDLKGGAAKIGYPFVGLLGLPFQAIQELGTGGRYLYSKAKGISDEDFYKEEARLAQDTKAGEEATGIINPIAPGGTGLLEAYNNATGGRGRGVDPLQRTIQGGLAAGLPGAVANIAGELTEEFAPNLPAPAKAAIDAAAFVLAMKGGQNIKMPSFKATKRVLSAAEEIATKTGMTAEEVLQKAQSESGANFEKALQGDASEINKFTKELKGEAASLSKKVTEAPKEPFNAKEAIAKQEKTVGLLKSEASPIGEYFTFEKPVEKRPETLAKEAENRARVEPLVNETNTRLQEQRSQLRELKADRRSLSGNELDRVNSSISLKERQIDKTLNELKDLQYELRYSRKPPSEAEIDAQIKKSGEEIAREAANPTEKGQKAIERQLELDRDYIEKAQKLAERGELPGEIRPDTFVKMKKKYLDGYNSLIKEQRELIRELRGARDAESLKKIADSKNFIDQLEKRASRLKADIVNQTDKIKTMSALSGPPGAFYKQQLKNLHPDIQAFQKDFFHHQKLRNVEPIGKTEKVAHKSLKDVEKVAEEFAKNPTKENSQKAAEVTGENAQSLKHQVDNFGDIIKKHAEKAEQGKATEVDIQKTSKDIDMFGKRWMSRNKMIAKNVAINFGVGILKGVLEDEFGLKIPSRYSDLIVAGVLGRPSKVTGRAVGVFGGSQLVHYIYDKKEAEKLKEIRKDSNEYAKYVNGLKKRYSAKRVNSIIEDSLR